MIYLDSCLLIILIYFEWWVCSHLVMLRAHSWFCTQISHLALAVFKELNVVPDQIRVGHMQGECFNPGTISHMLPVLTNFSLYNIKIIEISCVCVQFGPICLCNILKSVNYQKLCASARLPKFPP